ncbi:MAG: RNA polymerase sigma factor [Ilumatobacteraceae bacterium]
MTPYDGGVPQLATVDRDVVARFRSGDEQAVAAVYRAYSGMVHSVARRILHDGSLADEATQQTFLQAWRSASAFDGDRDLGPWMATIARRVAIDIYRREARRPATRLDDANPGDAALVTLPPNEAQAWEAAQVRLAIDALAPDEREVVRLQHLDGLTHVEIAERLGIALGTVKSRSFRAHRSLASRLRYLREVDM